jgi:hypothetical protein
MMQVHIGRKAERAMKKGQSREMGNIRNKTYTPNKITQKTKR